jgi:hypothetical protein
MPDCAIAARADTGVYFRFAVFCFELDSPEPDASLFSWLWRARKRERGFRGDGNRRWVHRPVCLLP